MGAKREIFYISKFSEILSFIIVPGMVWWNLTKIDQILILYKFAKDGCFLAKIKGELSAYKGLLTTHATPGDYLAPDLIRDTQKLFAEFSTRISFKHSEGTKDKNVVDFLR